MRLFENHNKNDSLANHFSNFFLMTLPQYDRDKTKRRIIREQMIYKFIE